MRANLLVTALLGASLMLASAPVSAQDAGSNQRNQAYDRAARIRQHEQRIREMIEKRRNEALERERQERERQAAVEGQQPAEQAAPAEAPPAEETGSRAVSSVVMGFRFVDEKGHSDYNIIVEEGDTFMSEVTLFNIDENPIDRVRLALDFDRRFIEPVKIFDTELRERLTGDPRFEVTERDAIIIYDGNLAKPMTDEQVVLLRILWKAHRRTPYTGIQFAFDELEEADAIHTAIYAGESNILGVAEDARDGVLSGGLMVAPPTTETPVLQGKGEELKTLYLGSVASNEAVGLRLTGPDEPIAAGEEFWVYLVLNNPFGALIDALDACVRFDPEVLQVVDEDKFNVIRRGVNINDGPFLDNFNWDMHKRNEVRNDWGIINYQMALGDGGPLPSKTLAKIRFRALAPTNRTQIYMHKGTLAQVSHSSVRYFGYERLDLDNEISSPVINLAIGPAPRRETAETPRNESPTVKAEKTRVRTLPIERE